MLELVLLGLLNGITWGLMLSLVALGLSITFGLMRIVNAAHGEFYMLGAILSWVLVSQLGNFWMALPLVSLILFALGISVERIILRRLEGSELPTLASCFGLALILRYSTLLGFGGHAVFQSPPIPGSIQISSVEYPVYRLYVGILALICLLVLWILIFRTKFGVFVRAAQEDPMLAKALGIRTERIYLLMFGLCTVLAGLAGQLVSPIVQVSFSMGTEALVLGFIVVIVGGLGSLKGTFVSSLIIAGSESLITLMANPEIARIASLAVLVGVMTFRPHGLFGIR